MLSVYPNLDNFNRPVEGAMKLLRACFCNFQCIFHLARLNNCNWLKKNHCGIKICIWYVLQYFEEFINFVEGCGSYELLAVPDSRIGPWTTFGSGCATMWLTEFLEFFPYSQEMICTMT